MPEPMTVTAAHAFFAAAHTGQTDAQGRDYYTHHLAPIAASVEHLGDDAIIAALGHDYIEDIHAGALDSGVAALKAAGTPDRAIAAIVAVTRRPGETYATLIARAAADPLACEIKLADNTHNIAANPALAATDPAKAHSLLTKRYLPARDQLITARTHHHLDLPPQGPPMTQPVDKDAPEGRDRRSGIHDDQRPGRRDPVAAQPPRRHPLRHTTHHGPGATDA